MSANDRNEAFADKNDGIMFDNAAAADGTDGELSQDELNNVAGGGVMFKKPEQPDRPTLANRPSDDPSEGAARS